MIDRCIEQLTAEGVTFKTGMCVGRDLSASQLRNDFDAVLPNLERVLSLVREVAAAKAAKLGRSLYDALLAGTVVVTLAVVIGHAAARRRRGGVGLDAVAVLAFVTPASVLGVGLIAAWNRPSLQAVYGTSAIVALALAARYSAVGLRTAAVSFSQASEHYEEAAAIGGARFLRRLGRILVPIHARGLAAAWLLAVVFCLRDLETAVLLYPAGQEPLTVRIFTLEANGPEPVVAALSCVQVGMTAGVLLVGSALLFRRRP